MKDMANDQLLDLIGTAKAAEQAVEQELQRLYPIGSEVRVRLQTNHREPSVATVIGYHPSGLGSLRVQLHAGHRTSVHCTAIVE